MDLELDNMLLMPVVLYPASLGLTLLVTTTRLRLIPHDEAVSLGSVFRSCHYAILLINHTALHYACFACVSCWGRSWF